MFSAVLLAGCGNDEDPASDDVSASASEGAGSVSPTEAESPSPTVAPATGKVIRVEY